MLAYILAIAVGLSSLALFLAAFFRPKLHRQDDFLWSGIGLFYALVLWLCAEQLRGGLLLGQVAAASLALTFGWQTLKLRWAIANLESIAQAESFSLLAWVKNRIGKSPTKKQPSVTPTKPEAAVTPVVATPTAEETPPTPQKDTIEQPVVAKVIEEITVSVKPSDMPSGKPKEAVKPPKPPAAVKSPKPTQEKEGFSLKKFFSRGKQAPPPKTPAAKPPNISTVLDSEVPQPKSDRVDETASVSPTPDATVATSQPAAEAETYASYEPVESESVSPTTEETAETSQPVAESVETEAKEVESVSPTPEETVVTSQPAAEAETHASYQEVESEPTNKTDSPEETENKPENLPPPSEV